MREYCIASIPDSDPMGLIGEASLTPRFYYLRRCQTEKTENKLTTEEKRPNDILNRQTEQSENGFLSKNRKNLSFKVN